MTTIIDTKTVLCALNPQKHVLEYVAVDSQSGGYYYWTSDISSAQDFGLINCIESDIFQGQNNMTLERDINVLELEIIVKSDTPLATVYQNSKQEKINNLQRQIKLLQNEILAA
jgi:hypothetical protein